MNTHTAPLVNDVLVWAKTWGVDLPLATTQWAVGIGTEQTATTAAWRGYDASIRMLTHVVDAFYRAPTSALVFSQTVNAALRWQRLSNAVTGMVLAGLRPVGSLPVAGLRQELQATTVLPAAEVRERQQLRALLLQQPTPASQAPKIRPLTHGSTHTTRRHPRPYRHLSLPVKQIAHQHRH